MRTKPEGLLVVKVIGAKGLVSKDVASSNDPYVELWIKEGERQSTHVINNETAPIWNSLFTFPLPEDYPLNVIHFRVYDKDVIGKDLIGDANIEFRQAADQPTVDIHVDLKNRNSEVKSLGQLHVAFEFRPGKFEYPASESNSRKIWPIFKVFQKCQ